MLSPAFAAATLAYTLDVPAFGGVATVAPVAANPSRSTLTIAGVASASGASSAPIAAGSTASIRGTTESGATRTYTVAVRVSAAVYLKASNTGTSDEFGTSVALSGDGTTLAVGAPLEDSNATGIGGIQTNNTATDAGAVYVFRRSAVTWAQEAYVKALNTDANDAFGCSVALSDGALLAVGATGEDSNATGVGGSQTDNSASSSGAVYIY